MKATLTATDEGDDSTLVELILEGMTLSGEDLEKWNPGGPEETPGGISLSCDISPKMYDDDAAGWPRLSDSVFIRTWVVASDNGAWPGFRSCDGNFIHYHNAEDGEHVTVNHQENVDFLEREVEKESGIGRCPETRAGIEEFLRRVDELELRARARMAVASLLTIQTPGQIADLLRLMVAEDVLKS